MQHIIYTIALVLPTAIGCASPSDSETGGRVSQSRSERVWSVSGERRLTSMFFPWNKRLDQDRFRVVRSDGKRWVAALGAQANDNQPHDPYLYIIDGSEGKVRYIAPSIASHIYCIGSEFTVLVAAPKNGKQAFEVRSTADGSLVRRGDVSEYQIDQACSVAIVDNVVRLIDPEGRREVFFESQSGKQLTKDQLGSRAKEFAGLSLPIGGSWSVSEIMEDSSPEQARCGDLVISINPRSRSQIVATREKPSSRPATEETVR